MPLQERKQGTAKEKRNLWYRGNGICNIRGELKRGISLNKKRLKRKVRHRLKESLNNSSYKKVCSTLYMEVFT